MTLNMTFYLCNIILNCTRPILWNVGSTQMNTLCGMMVVLHNSNLDKLGIMLPSNGILGLRTIHFKKIPKMFFNSQWQL